MSDGLRAGVCRVDITPPLGLPHGSWRLRRGLATGVHDPLVAQALALTRGDASVLIITTDLLLIDRSLSLSVRERAAELTGIDSAAVMLTASHNHVAPVLPAGETAALVVESGFERYRDSLAERIAGAAFGAFRARRAARLGVGTGSAPGVSVNRVRPERPTSPSVGLIRVDDEASRPFAAIVHWAAHPTTVGGHVLEWSADYPGALRSRLEADWPGLEVLFLQGCAGDVAPLDHWFGNPQPRPMGFAAMDEVGRVVAGEAHRLMGAVHTRSDAPVALLSETVELPARVLPYTRSEVERAVSRLEGEAAAMASPPEVWPEDVHVCTAAQRQPAYYQLGLLRQYREIMARQGEPYEVLAQAVRVGDCAILATPFELFGALGEAVVAASPVAPTFVAGYANDCLGYLPPSRELEHLTGQELDSILDQDAFRWAYGITNSRLDPGGAEKLVERAGDLLRRLVESGMASEGA